jgi:hypothetical protein
MPCVFASILNTRRDSEVRSRWVGLWAPEDEAATEKPPSAKFWKLISEDAEVKDLLVVFGGRRVKR